MEKEFFRFIYERQLIWYKRFVLKESPPWTEDEILQKFKIINMYRELDRCTIYILNKLKNVKDRKKVLINVIFFRFFNLDKLYEKLGIRILEEIDAKKLKHNFYLLKNKGPIFNNAYLISSGTKGKEKHSEILENLQKIDFENLVKKLDNSKTPRDSLEEIQKIPLIGPFLACEIWTDLTYFKFFRQNWNDNNFVNIGPGAKWGLEIIYGKLDKENLQKKLERLHQIQKNFLNNKEWKKIAYKKAFSNYPFLSLTNIEGALCEFRKYFRLKKGKGKRRKFIPSSQSLY